MSHLSLPRFDLYLTKNKSATDTAQIPANGVVVSVYRQGGTTNGGGSIAPAGSGVINVRHPGRMAVGQVVFVTSSPSITATITAVTATSITVTAGASTFVWTDGARITSLSARPTTYIESTGNVQTPSSSEVTTDSLGHGFWYADEGAADVLYTLDGSTFTTIQDFGGVAGNVWRSNEFDAATAKAFIFAASRILSTSGAKFLDVQDYLGASVFSVDKDGKIPLGAIPVLGAAQIGTGAVGSDEIATGAVGSDELAALAVIAGKIAVGAVATADIAAEALIKISSAVGSTDYTLASASFALITGATLTLTPFSTGSKYLIIGNATVKQTTANATVTSQIRLQNTTDGVTLQEAAGDTGAATEWVSLTAAAILDGFAGSKTIELQGAEINGGNGTPIIESATTNRKARIIAIEFKKVV